MKRNKIRKQLMFLSFLFFICIVSSSMIILGVTVFRKQIPLFQLIDGGALLESQLNPPPEPNPGVTNVESVSNVEMYLIMGSDFRPESGYRTDTILLVIVDNQSGKASVVSFPRDLWVSIPGYGENRINTVMQLGGFQLLANTLQTNFGVYPTQYAMVDMEGFLDVVDILEGITVNTDKYTGDACDGSLDPDRWCEVGPGSVPLDSQYALWYVRARYNSSDFDRMRRTQEVVKAIFTKMITPSGLLKAPQLIGVYDSSVESNISSDELLPLARFGMGFDLDEDVRWYIIGQDEVTSWMTPAGAAVLLPNTPVIQSIIQDALNFE